MTGGNRRTEVGDESKLSVIRRVIDPGLSETDDTLKTNTENTKSEAIENPVGEAQLPNQRLTDRSAPPGSQSALPDGLLHEVYRAGIPIEYRISLK